MIRRLRGPAADDVRDIDRAIVIGRANVDVDVDDSEVSRRHAVVRPVAEGVEVEDLGSRNGTFVDEEQVKGKLTITKPATLRVGGTELRIEVELPQVTRVRAIPQPDVTVQRPIPDVTVARPQPAAPQAAPAAAPAASPPAGAPHTSPPQAGTAGGPAKTRRTAAFAAGGLVVGAVVAVALILLLGGSSTKKTAKTLASGSSHCAAHFPPIIHDGFPEPQMRFSHNGVLDTSLHMAPTKVTIGGHTYATGMEYDHQFPGPTLVFCPGDRVNVHLINGLPLPTNLHVHGLHVSPNGDGDNVFIDVKPLSQHTYQYQIPLDQFPGFYWYHPHLHPFVQPEEAGGAAGAIVVEGSLDDRLPNIPQRLIVIQGGNRGHPQGAKGPPASAQAGGASSAAAAGGSSSSAAAGGSSSSAAAGGASSSAAAGGPPSSAAAGGPPKGAPPPVGVPELLINGVPNPTLKIRPGQIQRWRIVNAASDRIFRLVIPGVTFELLAEDGVTLRTMRPERELLIGSGSRVEVLVRGGPTGVYPLTALPFHQCHKGCNPFAGPPSGVITPKEDLLTMISSGTPAHDQLPTGPIGNPPDLRHKPVNVHRTLLLTSDPVAATKPTYRLDQKLFDPNRVDITMKLGSVEEWTLKNPAGGPAFEWHTFHIHQNPFQVISINGKPLNYVDWQDNVTLAPGDTVVIRINPIDFTGKFVFHCHVIFHEDHGMMGTVQVLPNPTAAQVNTNRVMYLVPPAGKGLYASASRFLYYCTHLLAQGVA